ncbi:hypothetical protein IAU59_001410 [Kwoniella sp. CBS 9459]
MPSSLILLIFATIPLVVLLLPRYIEPYSLVDPIVLNARDEGYEGRETRWFNMGWWEDTDIFPVAAEALASKLLTFAQEGGYQGGGNVLDIGHGAGESLLLHLNSSSCAPPKTLHGLTSLALDTSHAKSLLASHPEMTRDTQVELFTSSAEFRQSGSRASDLEHPLNPMKGFLGERSADTAIGGRRSPAAYDADDDDDEVEVDEGIEEDKEHGIRGENRQVGRVDNDGPIRYDLVYVLDSIYHYRASVPRFLSTVRPVLRVSRDSDKVDEEGNHDDNHSSQGGGAKSGMVVYTDLLPPPTLSYWKAIVISHLMSVPLPNLTSRPLSSSSPGDRLVAYKDHLEADGWTDVVVEDWSRGVWPGFANNLRSKGGIWAFIGETVAKAEKDGWMFVAVRAKAGSGP